MMEDLRVSRGRWLLAGLLALSLLVKLILVWLSQEINQDAVRYINAAHLFSQGELAAGVTTGGRTFLLPWLIYLMHHFLSDWVLAGQLISAIAISLALIPFFLIAKNLFGNRAAIWVGLGFVISPVLNEYSVEVIREPLFLFFFGWAIWAILKVLESRGPFLVLLAFVAIFGSFLCRIETILTPAFFLVFLVGCVFFDRNSFDKRFKYSLYLFISLLILSSFIVIGSANVLTLRIDYIGNYINEIIKLEFLSNYYLIYEKLKAFGSSLPNSQWAHSFGSTTAKLMPIIYLMGLFSAFISVSFPPFFAFIFYGLIQFKLPTLKHKFCFFLAIFYLVSAFFFLIRQNFISERYLVAPAVLLFPWLGSGMEKLFELFRSRRLYLTIAVLVFLILPAGATIKMILKHESIVADAGAWIRESIPTDRQLFFNDERIALRAGLWRGEYVLLGDQAFKDMQHLPMGTAGDWVIYKISAKGNAPSLELQHFELVRVFKGAKKSIFVYKRA